jgi:hypothetical protein
VRKAIAKAVTIITVSLLLLCLLPASVAAIGLGVGPSVLEIEDALRGSVYYRTIQVGHTGEEGSNFSLSADGEISDWVSFYKSGEPDTPTDSIFIPAGETGYVRVKFTIPEDARNKTYEGRLYVGTIPSEEATGEVGQVVKIKVPVDVTIEVIGSQILEGTVSKITAKDTEVGLPLNLEVGFTNTGNVNAQPDIGVRVVRNDETVAEFNHAQTSIKVDSSETIRVEWDTTGQEADDYSADVEVSLGGRVIAVVGGLMFKLLPPGTLSREGELVSLDYKGQPEVETITKVQATFRNTGEVDTRAKLVAEVYRQDSLIDTLESEELLIPTGEEEILTAYFEPAQPGDYKINGHVMYEGKKTETMEISFTVGGEGAAVEEGGTELGQSSLIILIVAAVVVILGAIVYMVLRSRKRLPYKRG